MAFDRIVLIDRINEQLAAIATKITELPSNLAKALADVILPSSTVEGTPAQVQNPRTILLPQLDQKNFMNVHNWTPELYKARRKKKMENEDKDSSENEEQSPGVPSTSSKGSVSTLSSYMEDENGNQILTNPH